MGAHLPAIHPPAAVRFPLQMTPIQKPRPGRRCGTERGSGRTELGGTSSDSLPEQRRLDGRRPLPHRFLVVVLLSAPQTRQAGEA